MSFENSKKQILKKFDKSQKGSIDLPIKKLIKSINNNKDYVTTSSCSGRTVLIIKKRKKGSIWLYKTHNSPIFKDFLKNLIYKTNEKVYLRYEPLILHIQCNSLENAQGLVNKARDIGFRRSGIQSIKKSLIEISSSEYLEILIKNNNKILITNDYLEILIKEIKIKYKTNKKKIKLLETIF